jgi:alcohol dehydrogenase (NADP+)
MQMLSFIQGDHMPAVGLGTWKSPPGEVYHAVKAALQLGYRHIDCAPIYGNEKEVGAALAESIAAGVVRREDVWLTSKLWNNAHLPQDVVPALKQTLADLQTSYLDLFLIHWPVAFKPDVVFPESGESFLSLEQAPLEATWQALEGAQAQGLARHIGVSNFSIKKLTALLKGADQAPEMNQVELHPYLAQTELVEWCQARNIHVTAYSPLGSPDRHSTMKRPDEPVLLEDPVVLALAERLQSTPAQVLLAWVLARGLAVVPKSVNPTRMAINLAAPRVTLDTEAMQALARLDRHHRYVDGSLWAVPGSSYALEDLWN